MGYPAWGYSGSLLIKLGGERMLHPHLLGKEVPLFKPHPMSPRTEDNQVFHWH